MRVSAYATERTVIGMSACWQPAVRRPIGRFCAHEGWLHGVPVAAPNGGSARVLLDVDPDHSSPSAAAGNEVGITSARQGAPQL
jgi:hypothetical protein